MDKVNVFFPHYGQIKRVLHKGHNGLYVKYQGQRVSVRQEYSGSGEPLASRVLHWDTPEAAEDIEY